MAGRLMPWFKVDDTLHSHPKARRISLAALGLWTMCGSHNMAYKLDGFVPEWVAHGYPQGKKLAAELLRTGLWESATRGDESGYQYHDWLHCQQSAEEIERDREHNRKRQRDFRHRLRNGKPKEGE